MKALITHGNGPNPLSQFVTIRNTVFLTLDEMMNADGRLKDKKDLRMYLIPGLLLSYVYFTIYQSNINTLNYTILPCICVQVSFIGQEEVTNGE